jgi:hypothetical protein
MNAMTIAWATPTGSMSYTNEMRGTWVVNHGCAAHAAQSYTLKRILQSAITVAIRHVRLR